MMARLLRNASSLGCGLFLQPLSQTYRKGLLGASTQLSYFSSKKCPPKFIFLLNWPAFGLHTFFFLVQENPSQMSEKDLALKQAMYHITTSFGKGSIMWLGCSAPVKQVPVVSTGDFTKLDFADYNGPCRASNQLGSIGYSTEQFFSKLRKPNTA